MINHLLVIFHKVMMNILWQIVIQADAMINLYHIIIPDNMIIDQLMVIFLKDVMKDI